MPKILVRVADEKLSQDITATLIESNKRLSIVTGPAITPDQDLRALAGELVETKAAVVIVDYLADDSASVKLLQSATESARMPHFIFIMPEQFDIGHALMAVNEGASALIQRPVKMPSLVNYVERAISGPGRFRKEQRGVGADTDIADLENQIRIQRQYNVAVQKLVSYLLSTPLAEQRRQALIVSDSAYQRDLLKKVLEYHFFNIHTATNASEGIKIALEEKPLFVISDLELEGLNGIEFCRSLKSENKLIPCHFVICTANQAKYDTIMAPGNGVDDCVIKSADDNDYREFITRVAIGLMLEEVKKATSLTRFISSGV